MTWTTFDELQFRGAMAPEVTARLSPMPELMERVLRERKPYTGPERRSTFSAAARARVEAAEHSASP